VSALSAAWQAALAAEHQAVFGYALLGPHLSGADQQLAVANSDAHESLRNRTEDSLGAAGLTPVAPRADYPTLYPVPSARAARALAVRLEDACASAWRFLYAQAASGAGAGATGLRTSAQSALTASAVRASRWRVIVDPARPTTAFPGI
jgi:cytosine/adenosine deaminase-related metal-dependent hydrolase